MATKKSAKPEIQTVAAQKLLDGSLKPEQFAAIGLKPKDLQNIISAHKNGKMNGSEAAYRLSVMIGTQRSILNEMAVPLRFFPPEQRPGILRAMKTPLSAKIEPPKKAKRKFS